jgi:hypothetical protein
MVRRSSRAVAPVALAIVLVSLSLLSLQTSRAQDAAETLPAAPGPELCHAEPRPMAEYEAMLGTTAPDPAATFEIAAGKPADQATIDAVTSTLIEAAACINAGEFRRLGGLYTDAGFADDAAGLDQETLDFYAASHDPAPVDDRYAIFAVALPQVLSDGRVAAIVQFQQDGAGGADLMLFAEEDGRYLIDNWVDGYYDITPAFDAFQEAATPAATPAA